MKKTKRVMLLACAIMISMMSCNNEELFIEPVAEEVLDGQVEDNEGISNEDTEDEYEVDASSPCDFTLNEVKPYSTIIINCVLDLEGATVNLPEGVSFIYEGGDIINGTINLSDSSIISGELLNATLTLGGSVPQMKDTTFNFDPKRWGIIEGKVSDEVALNNKNIINNVIYKVKEMGITTFKIDKMDAYFGVDIDERDPYFGANGTNRFAIFMPSNFNLIMTENTNLRVQPNGFPIYSLLFSWEVDNITISGGKLWGDRYAHDYTTISGTHEWGHLIRFKAVHNGVVDNVEMREGTGDGFEVYGSSDRNADGTLKPNRRESVNITVKNCLIDDNRRNNLTVADGKDIYIDNNIFRNAGSTFEGEGHDSNAIAPAVAFIIEGREGHRPDGNSIDLWETTENVHVRNNLFEENRVDIVLLTGEKTFIYDNTFKSHKGISLSVNVDGQIYNNSFENKEALSLNSFGISLQSKTFANGEFRSRNYEVANNTITGYHYGILASGEGHKIKDNTITDCQGGIVLGKSKDLEFDNNTIYSKVDSSKGYFAFSGETSIKNCLIKNGSTDVQGRALSLSDINNEEEGEIIIDNIVFNGDIVIDNAQNITVQNSTFNNIEVKDCNPTLIDNN